MTQPIQEPTTPRALSRSTWRENQLERRPPLTTPGGSTTSAYLADVLANGTGASVANDTWEDVVTGVDLANSRWFDEFNDDPAGQWSTVFNNGAIHNSASLAYNYAAWGYVVFDVADGVLIGALINWVGQEVQQNTTTTVDGVTRVEVYAERTPIPAGGVELRCYQASGGAADILEARLHVRRFELYEDVYEQEFAT
jgi:uncharacterized membrane protein